MAFPNDIHSATPSKYLFKLISNTEELICDTEPCEWASGKINIKRDLEAGGVFVSSNADTLTFVGNAAKMLKDLYMTFGFNAKCTLVQYWWKEFDFVDPEKGRKYIEFPSTYNIDFNFYQKVKIGGFSFGIRVKAVNSSMQTKLDQRQDTNVDLNKLVSIGDYNILDRPLGDKKFINYQATNQRFYAELKTPVQNGILYDLPRVKGFNCYASLPFDVQKNDFVGDVQAVKFTNRIINISAVPKILESSEFDRTLTVKYTFHFWITNDNNPTAPWTLMFVVSDLAEVIFDEIELATFGNDTEDLLIDDSTTIDLKKGQSLRLVVKTGDISGIKAGFYSDSSDESMISFSQDIITSPARKVEGWPIYETFERLSQHIFDTQYPFYSDFFGRQNLSYADGVKYLTENQLSFAHIQNGLNLRGLTLADLPLAVNFKDLFKTASAIWGLGYSFEIIEGTLRLRIEKYSDFFKSADEDEIIFNPPLKSRFNKYDIESQVMIEYAPSNIKSGFDKYEYLEINGLAEPNTTIERTTILNTATKLENIASYRGDTKGILSSLATPIDTTDTKQDSDIFITKTQADGYEWKPERDENITILKESSVFREDLLNRYFTPSRMLKRQPNLKSALEKPYFSGTTLKFQTSDKQQNLRTLGTPQSGFDEYAITENQDIPVSTLSDPIILPMKHKVTCMFIYADLQVLQDNLYGWMDFGIDIDGNSVQGYLYNIDMSIGKDEAEITIVEKYKPIVV